MKRWEMFLCKLQTHRYAIPLYTLDVLRCDVNLQLMVVDVWRSDKSIPATDDVYIGQMVINGSEVENASICWVDEDSTPEDLADRILAWLNADIPEDDDE